MVEGLASGDLTGVLTSATVSTKYDSSLLLLLFWAALAVLVVAQGGLIYAVFHFRKREALGAEGPKQRVGVDLFWALVPIILLVILIVATYQRLTN